MFSTLLSIVLLFLLTGCASAPLNYHGRDASEEEISFIETHITDNVSASGLSSEVVINDDKRAFQPQDPKVFWIGFVENYTKPYSFVARWIAPDGTIAKETSCSNVFAGYYTCSMPINKHVQPSQHGEWNVEIHNRGGELVAQDRFSIGKSNDAVDFDLKKYWTDNTYNISSADAIVLKHEETIEVDERMFATRRIYKKIKILTEEGKKLAEVIEPFINTLESVEINFAHTILPNGKVIAQKEKLLGTISRFSPSYTASQALVMTMPSVEVGAVIEYEITFSPIEKLAEGLYFDEFQLADTIPKSSFNYKVTVPEDMELKIFNIKTNAQPVVTKDADKKTATYVWEDHNIRPVKKEQSATPYRLLGPSILVSNTTDWNAVTKWWEDLTHDKYKADAAIKKITEEITAGLTTTEEKIDKLYRYVHQNIRYVGFDFGRTIYEPADAAYVFKNKYGDCKNQSVLLKTMLESAGVSADIVLVRTNDLGPVERSIAGAGQFNHAIVVAYDKDKKYFLDPTVNAVSYKTIPFHIEGTDVLIVKKDGAEFYTTPVSNYKDNTEHYDMTIDIADDFSVNGKWRWTAQGQADVLLKLYFSYASEEQREQMLKKMFKQYFPSAEIESIDYGDLKSEDKDFEINVAFKLNDWLIDAESLLIMRLFSEEYVAAPETITDKRQGDIYNEFASLVFVNAKINFPPGLKLDKTPKDFELKSPVYSADLHFNRTNSSLELKGKFWTEQRVIKKEEFPAVKEFFQQFAKAYRQNIILKRP